MSNVHLPMQVCLKPSTISSECAFGFKAMWPICLAYTRSASRNCMIACDRARVATDLGLKGKAHVFRVCDNCISQYIIA